MSDILRDSSLKQISTPNGNAAANTLRQREAWLDGQKLAFQAAIAGRPLAISLGALVDAIVAQTQGEGRAAFYMIPAGGEGLRLLAGMTDEYASNVNGGQMGAESLACSMAMDTSEPVIIPDVELEPRWKPFLRMARKYNYRSCWSFPVRATGGPALGTLVMYFEEPKNPAPAELEMAAIFVHTAAVIITLYKESAERARADKILDESRQLLTRELEDTKLLQQLSNHIIDEDNIEDLYHTILLSAMKLMRSDFGSIQLFIPETKQLLLIASENFHPDSAEFWKYVDANSTSACGLALATGARVVVEDIEHLQFDIDEGDYNACRLSGIVSVQSTPLISRTGNHVGMMSTHWKKPHKPSERELGLYDVVARQVADLIERKNAEDALRKSEQELRKFNNSLELQVKERAAALLESKELLQAIFDASIHSFSVLKSIRDEQNAIVDFEWVYANKEVKQRTNQDGLVGKRFRDVYGGVESTIWLSRYARIVENGSVAEFEDYYEAADKWYHVIAQKFGDGLIVTSEDTTFRKKTERQIYRIVLDTQEEERKRIAENLHNGLGQILYGVKLGMGQLDRKDLSNANIDALKRADKLLTDAIAESRRLSHELMPVILEDFGLKTAIEDMCRQLGGETLFKCRFKGLAKNLDKHIEAAVYRIIQELLTNIVKHAHATETLIAIETYKSRILVLVQDNGRGFDVSSDTGNGIGLKSIRNKISLLNGHIDFVSEQGKGTIINMYIPLKHQ